MDDKTAQMLSRLTREFYDEVADSFSETREAPWQGWEQAVGESGVLLSLTSGLRVLDLACGNLRFERWLSQVLVERDIACAVDAYAYDSSKKLVSLGDASSINVHFRCLDVAGALFGGENLGEQLGVDSCDLSVCFGFMHHLALPEHRVRVLQALVDVLRPGGVAAVSFWQLSKNPRLLQKAQKTTQDMAPRLGLQGLGPHDYLLGWQGRSDVVRYCHDFPEEEIDRLAASVAPRACEVARFSADGKTGNLNRYLVLRRA